MRVREPTPGQHETPLQVGVEAPFAMHCASCAGSMTAWQDCDGSTTTLGARRCLQAGNSMMLQVDRLSWSTAGMISVTGLPLPAGRQHAYAASRQE